MTKLLVSVRNVVEARTALAAGADLIDVKEPDRGALGMADVQVLDQIVTAIADRVPSSAALGELFEGHRLADRFASRLTYAKVGLARAAGNPKWAEELRAALEQLPAGVAPVAVAYADWQTAAAPSPTMVLDAAVQTGCRGLLVDTFDKTSGGLLAHTSARELEELTRRARQANMLVVLAGKIDCKDLGALLPLEPDYLGVRGAVCVGGRQGTLETALVRRMAELVSGTPKVAVRISHQFA